ncbi:MAG: hypothetical protein M3N18_01005 [Actinomycetota bacterium]|nr:hypothetical protein [Actinomycetota bacterium]
MEAIFEAPNPDRDGSIVSLCPRGAETYRKPGLPQLPRQLLYERGRRHRRIGEAHDLGLEHGFGKGGVSGGGA